MASAQVLICSRSTEQYTIRRLGTRHSTVPLSLRRQTTIQPLATQLSRPTPPAAKIPQSARWHFWQIRLEPAMSRLAARHFNPTLQEAAMSPLATYLFLQIRQAATIPL